MSVTKPDTAALEKQLLALQEEVAVLRKKNTDFEEHLKAYSLINTGQISLINKLIDKVPFGVMLLNESNTIIHANFAAGKIFSTSAPEMKGQSCDNYFKFYDRDKYRSTNSSTEEITLHQINCVNRDKHILHSAFVSDEGSEKIIVETFVDITEIKRAEQELIKTSKTKDEFLGMISHELRTPLNVIHGYSSLLEDELSTIKNTNVSLYVEHIRRAGDMLLQVVNNLLELSDLTAGKIHADNIPIDIQTIVTQLQYRVETVFAEDENKLSFNYEDINPFEQDLTLLLNILHELLVNANKFTEAGEVIVSIFLEIKDGADWLCFKISDTGCGMTDETMKHIFSAFHQADSSLARSYEGLGLGLSLVEKILNIMNGYIEVESEIDKGSTFTVFLPYKKI